MGQKSGFAFRAGFLGRGIFLRQHLSFLLLDRMGTVSYGSGRGISEAPFTSLLSQIFPGEEGYALNLSQISFGLGAATAPFLAGFLLERGFSWRLFYLFPGMVSLVIFAFLSREKLLEEKGMEGGGKSPLRRREGNGFIIVSFLAMFLYVGAEIGSFSWITTLIWLKAWEAAYPGGFLGCLNHRKICFCFSLPLSPILLFCVFFPFLSLIFLFLNFTHEVHWAILALGRSRVWLFCCLAFDSGLGSAKNGGKNRKKLSVLW